MKNKEIKTEIDDELRQKGRYTKSLSDELYASYEDELSSLKEEGVSEDEAREEAKRSLMSSMEELPAKPGRKYAYSDFAFLLPSDVRGTHHRQCQFIDGLSDASLRPHRVSLRVGVADLRNLHP